jgi:ribonucleoside-triphosphate reductase (formate)
MTQDASHEHLDPDDVDREGAFDAQMSLPLPFEVAPEPFSTVLKRSGREEPFERAKIANAIFQAAHSLGGQDRDLADSLARAVTIYLTKQLGSHVPTVDHIHDAVERVLIQMAHVRTAFAYARYRDRRARIRRLREGDMRALLDELREARRDDAPAARPGLFVRTSSDTLISWDRKKIVDALIRETELEPTMAEVIAMEVEGQLESAKIEYLTTSLVREMVAARLIAHDLGEHRERHRLLGVPLYDCERIIRGLTDATTGRDPVGTDNVLAGAVKKEYALSEIHALHVSEAHLEGAIHLHGLDKPDRLHGVILSPAMVAAFGVGLPGTPDFVSPPRNPSTFLAQLAKATATYQACVAGPVHWDAINFHFAPFVQDFTSDELTQFAQMMVYEFAYRALAHGGDGPGTELRFYWTAPPHLASLKAVGPDSEVTERSYADMEHAAQQLAWKFLEILAASDGLPVIAPRVGICLEPTFFRAPGHEAFLNKAAGLVEAGYPIQFYFDRSPATEAYETPWRPLDITFQRVAINLPRIAYISGKEGDFMDCLDRCIGVAGLALSERYDFLEGLAARGAAGPLALLSVAAEGGPILDLRSARGLVSATGLNEAVEVLYGVSMHESEEARALGTRIVERLGQRCVQEGNNRNLLIELSGENVGAVGHRFSTLDSIKYPKTSKTTIKVNKSLQTMDYTAGVAFERCHQLSPFEAVQYEGSFHRNMERVHLATVLLPESGLAGESIADFIRKAQGQTDVNGIRLLTDK